MNEWMDRRKTDIHTDRVREKLNLIYFTLPLFAEISQRQKGAPGLSTESRVPNI